MDDAPRLFRQDDAEFESFIRRAVRRIRTERLQRTAGVALWVLAGGLAIFFGTAMLHPELIRMTPAVLTIAAAALLLAADAGYFWQVDRRRALARLDRALQLSDATLSAGELAAEARDEWRERQRSRTLAELNRRSWKEHWPLRWPRRTWLAAGAVMLLGGALLQRHGALIAAERPQLLHRQAQFEALEEVFKDWEQAQPERASEELRALMEALQPLRERMAEGKLTEKEALVALSRVEEKLAAARRELDAQSLESSAAELAGALEPIEGMSSLAAALRRRDFAAAEQLAAKAAEKLDRPGAELPKGAKDPINQSRLANLAKNLEQRGQGQVSKALSQMSQGMKQGEPKESARGMKGLSSGLGKQAARNAEAQRLKLQLAQMGQCKECIGSGQSLSQGMSLLPKLSMMKQNQPGKGAGSAIDPNRAGPETQLASNRTEEKLAGTADAGDAEVTTEKTGEAPRESAAAARTAQFQQYEQLSREAIADENIPLAHREAIRRYFERIRPAEGK
jgi:hypothetical protein